VRYIKGVTLLNLALTTSWINAVVIAPVVEELLFRGVILKSLNTKLKFAYSNLLTAFLFLIIHLPGWYFKNKLRENILNPVGGAFSIFLLGLLFGWVAQKTKSVSGSIVVHCLNNLSSI
jgi:membrane protease YdiL (CAAX protease family)